MFKEILKTIKQTRATRKQFAYRSGWDMRDRIEPIISISDLTNGENIYTSSRDIQKKDKRIEKKPVEVFKEIISKIPEIDCSNLDEKIKIVTNRMDVLESAGVKTSDEKDAIDFLKARQKLIKVKDEFKWATVTFEKVEKLCNKYKLKEVAIDNFYKTLPMEAIDELEKFITVYKKVSNVKPILRLIIDDFNRDGKKKIGKEQRKDPILLASSPFGKWYYLLGAWDREVEIIDDLIYKGK